MTSLRLAPLALLLACNPAANNAGFAAATARTEVKAALERYMIAARAVDAEAIAASFSPTATLFEPGIIPIEGRDSIRAFVASFPGVRVDSATAVPDTIEIFGTTALVWGSYFERLSFSGQPVSVQDGKFVMKWVRQPDGAWVIERYFRVPLSDYSR